MRNYRTFQGAAAVLLGVTAVLPAQAAPLAVTAVQDASQPSTFSLDFGDLGGVASAQISATRFSLNIDVTEGSAEFANYDQRIAPLTLPGGFSTGNLRVRVVPGSSSGSFNEFSGEFRTTETYEINFDGDLSAFGLISPVYLPSASVGTISVNPLDGGNVELRWAGSSFLPSPFQPGTFIEFDYTCAVDAAFGAAADNLVDLNLLPAVQAMSIGARLKVNLLARLTSASNSLSINRDAEAATYLRQFVQQVSRQAGSGIPAGSATQLIQTAQAAIDMLDVGDTGGDVGGRGTSKGRGTTER